MMWYFLSAFLGAVVGVLLIAIVTVGKGEDDYVRGYRKGLEDGRKERYDEAR